MTVVTVGRAKKGGHRPAYGRAKEHRSRARNVATHAEQLIEAATPLEDLPHADPATTMQLLINRVTRLQRYAAAQVDALRPGIAPNQSPDNLDHELWVSWDEQGNLCVEPSFWMHREKELTELLGKLTESAQKVGLSDRLVRVQEQQLQILGEALRMACKAAGLDDMTQKRVGSELRKVLEAGELEVLEVA